MRIKLYSNTEHWIRAIAGICAAVLLLAQTAGAAHFHSFPSSHQSISPTTINGDNRLCGLCLVRFHSPVTFAIAPHPAASVLLITRVLDVPRRALSTEYRSHLFGRAPPASL